MHREIVSIVLCDREGFSASTSVFDIRIVKDELGAQRVLFPVHLAADDGEQRLAVYEHPHAVLLDDLVELAGLVYVVEVIGKTGAALVAYANAYDLGRRSIEECAQSQNGCWGDRQGSFGRSDVRSWSRGLWDGGRSCGELWGCCVG